MEADALLSPGRYVTLHDPQSETASSCLNAERVVALCPRMAKSDLITIPAMDEKGNCYALQS
jgi:hypothetical protein